MKLNKLFYHAVVFLLLSLTGFYATAAEAPIRAQANEMSALTAINTPYFDAFKGASEDNWVYQLANDNQLQPHCYLSKDSSFATGEQTNYKGVPMTCIQIGMSTRIFWPTRWVNHCNTVGKSYSECMMTDIKN
ncbi:hypothetical protein ACNO6G_10745 [Vibrio harveyi]|uniref:hypothetical protein n=1 Tax=Vibrio harveyi TaxID=669 RepID=UPI001C98600F|nr:hypothetical protein [Vibrio harveyi]MBY6236819.1 hypothetical protein [Vibrio harveyi]